MIIMSVSSNILTVHERIGSSKPCGYGLKGPDLGSQIRIETLKTVADGGFGMMSYLANAGRSPLPSE